MSSTNPVSDWQMYRRLLQYLWPLRMPFLVSLLGFMLYASMDVLAADLMQYLIDSMGGSSPLDAAKKTGIISTLLSRYAGLDSEHADISRTIIPIIIILLAVIRGIGAYLGGFFVSYVGSTIVDTLRCQIFAHMATLPISYIESHASGRLVSRITFNVTQVTGAVTDAVKTLFREGLTVAFLFGYLLYINWQLTLTFIVVAPLIALIVNLVSKRFRKISKRLQNSMGDVTHVVSEAVNGSREMRIYGGQAEEIKRFNKVSAYTRKQQLKMASTNAAFSPVIQVLLTLSLSTLVWIGLNSKILQSMSPGLFVSYLIAAGVIGKPIRQLTGILNSIQKALAAAQDLFELLDEKPEAEIGNAELAHVNGEIRFDRVHFSYPGQQEETLKGISFVANPGEMIALVGASGGGKSTLVSLIPRFHNLDSGQILIDGQPIDALSLASLRRSIALVSQNVVLMNDTVYNNIAYGEMKNSSEEAVHQAARLAHAHEFIRELEQGYQTMIGDNGVRLSGGQRQRIAIARAILKNAPILILDEATSALDNESERLIQAALNDVIKGRTTFVIAHRLSTIERADRILVIDQGQIAESGTHQELLAKQGRYAELHNASMETATAQIEAQPLG